MVHGVRNRSGLRTDSSGATIVSADLLQRMPKILGNADPMRIVQSLPCVHTNSEYDCGFHVNGCETSHSSITLDGVPIYGVSHLLGFFSAFNPSHFSDIRLQRNPFSASSPLRLGADLDMLLTEDIPYEAVSADAAVGLMSSQGTLRSRLSKRSLLLLSARCSYLNILYGDLLDMEDFSLKYGFSDYNASFISKPTDRDCVKLNLYYGGDNADVGEHNYHADLLLKWSNVMASAEWSRAFRNCTFSNKAFLTGYKSRLSVDEAALRASLEANILEAGYHGSLTSRHLTTDFRYSYYDVMPQQPYVEGYMSVQPYKHSYTNIFSAGAAYRFNLSRLSSVSVGLRASAFSAKHSHPHTALDPYATLSVDDEKFGKLDVSVGSQSQYLWQTGFSSRGLPTEFWITSRETQCPPQRSLGLDLCYTKPLLARMFLVELRGYCNYLRNQVEYKGDLLELLNAYSLKDHLLYGKGVNLGASLMLQKVGGRLTGWLSYSWQHTRRSFNGLSDSYPSNHERPHELNVLATYRINKHWDIGTTLVFASGTPFTAATDMYLINGAIITQYGRHNSSRLPSYFRWDMSVNYDFNTAGRYKHGVNFSVYNLTAHANPIFYRIHTSRDATTVVYRPITFALPAMPSVSYYFKF